MSNRKKYAISIALLVFLLAATTVSPAFMEKPDPLGGGGWPKSVCFLFCPDAGTCTYAQWNLSKDGTFVDNYLSEGDWSLSGGVFTLVYTSRTYSGPVTGRATAGSFYGLGSGAFSGVYSPAGCSGVPPAPEFGFPSPDGSQ